MLHDIENIFAVCFYSEREHITLESKRKKSYIIIKNDTFPGAKICSQLGAIRLIVC